MTTYTPNDSSIVHKTKCDFKNRFVNAPVHLMQYDMEIPILAVELYQNGHLYTIPNGYDANIRFGKNDRTYVYNPTLGCDTDRHTVYFEITPQMTVLNGAFNAVIEVIDNIPFYELLKEKPENWDTERTSYYIRTGEEGSYVYTPVSDGAIWAEDTYYLKHTTGIAGTSYIDILVDRNPIQDDDAESTSEFQSLIDIIDSKGGKSGRTYIPITEDMCTVTTDSTKGVSPYSTSYGYTNITVDLDKSLLKEGLMIQFVVNTKLVVSSTYRNVRIRFGTDDAWHPLMTYTTSIAAGSAYLVKSMVVYAVYKTTIRAEGGFHLACDLNSNTQVYAYRCSTNVELPVGALNIGGSAASWSEPSTGSYKSAYAAVPNNAAKRATINPSTGKWTFNNDVEFKGNVSGIDIPNSGAPAMTYPIFWKEEMTISSSVKGSRYGVDFRDGYGDKYIGFVIDSAGNIYYATGNSIDDIDDPLDTYIVYTSTDGWNDDLYREVDFSVIPEFEFEGDWATFLTQNKDTTITLYGNSEQRFSNISTLNISYGVDYFESWIRFSTASSGSVTITLPEETHYLGSIPTFGNSETWELSIKDGYVLSVKEVAQ